MQDNLKAMDPNKGASSSSSSSSSSSDDGDFIQLAPTNPENPTILKNSEGIAGKEDRHDATFETKRTPPTQMMVRNDPPEAYRIPSSVFERTKSTAPMEWSVTSNDSLFSIHMGNNSFSGDQSILLDMSMENPSLPVLDLRKDPTQPIGTRTGGKAPEDSNKSPDIPPLPTPSKQSNVGSESSMHPGTSQSYHSEGSPTSMNSFAFPILTDTQAISLKVDTEKHIQSAEMNQQQSVVQEELKKQESLHNTPAAPNPPIAPPPPPPPAWKTWCSCFSCFPCCS